MTTSTQTKIKIVLWGLGLPLFVTKMYYLKQAEFYSANKIKYFTRHNNIKQEMMCCCVSSVIVCVCK